MKFFFHSNLCFLFSLLFLSNLVWAQNGPVQTTNGLVRGSLSTDKDVRIYKGIPFAAPPVGDLRWKAPQPVEPWVGVKQCDTFGPSPVQSPLRPLCSGRRSFLFPNRPLMKIAFT